MCEFDEQHKVLIMAEPRPESFLDAIEQALRLPADAATIARRREVAALSDWKARVEAMSELIEAAGDSGLRSRSDSQTALYRQGSRV